MSEKGKEESDFVESIRKGAEDAMKTGREISKSAAEKIDESAKEIMEKARKSPALKKLKTESEKAKKSGIEKGKEIQKAATPRLIRFGRGLLSALEKIVGAIRRGTQYGKTSLETLEQFAKMKELGIITDEEFEAKKKELLDRI